jgi:hypothetical protein
MIVLEIQEKNRSGKFDGWIDGEKIISAAYAPFFSCARRLMSRGVDPGTILLMRHKETGTDSLRAPVGAAAKLGVGDNRSGTPIFRAYRPGPEQ